MWVWNRSCNSKARLDGKTAVVTGCNTGIGKETVLDFVKRGARVVMACRDMKKAEAAADEIRKATQGLEGAGEVVLVDLDLASLESVRNCAENLLRTEPQINILVNNAGVMACPKGITKDGHEMQFGINHLGHFLFTLLLLPRILNIGGIDFEDLNWERKYSPTFAYARSKLANVLFAKELAEKLKGTGVTTYSLHPGVVSTELMRHFDSSYFKGSTWFINKIGGYFIKTPKQGAQTSIYCAVHENAASESGFYYSNCTRFWMWGNARNSEMAKKLWDVSIELVGLKNYDPFNTPGQRGQPTSCGFGAGAAAAKHVWTGRLRWSRGATLASAKRRFSTSSKEVPVFCNTLVSFCLLSLNEHCGYLGGRVVMACRDLKKADEAAEDIRKSTQGLEGVREVVVTKLDLSSLTSVRECAQELLKTEPRINILVNNAGVMACPKALTEDGHEMQFGVNHLGHFLLTSLLLPRIRNSTPARIVNVSSHAHWIGSIDFEDLNWEKNYSPSYAYARSKLANILFTKELAEKLKDTGVTTYAVHPGLVSTEIGRHLDSTLVQGSSWFLRNITKYFIKSPEQGAQTTIYCAVDENVITVEDIGYGEKHVTRKWPRNCGKINRADTMGLFGGKCTSKARLDGKTAVVTGCNTGIGKETVLDFVKRGARVIMACRDLTKAEEAAEDIRKSTQGLEGVGEVVVTKLDLSSLSSVRECATHLLKREPQINLLINNAGVMACPKALTEDGHEMQLAVNHLVGSFDFEDMKMERKYTPISAYGRSKLANILFTKVLAEKLKDTGVTTYVLHPGVVSTELGRHMETSWLYRIGYTKMFTKTPVQGAQTTIYCAVDENAGKDSGFYYSDCSKTRLWGRARNPELAQKLWEVSAQLVSLENLDPFTAPDEKTNRAATMKLFKGKCTSKARLDGKTAVVTGCNTGIGKETVRDFVKRGARVIMACRDLTKADEAAEDIRKSTQGLEGVGEVVVTKLDLSSSTSVRECATHLLKTEPQINLLILNAVGSINFEDMTMERKYTPVSAYSRSKLANILFTKVLAEKLKGSAFYFFTDSGVTTYVLHPGAIKTELGRHIDTTWMYRIGMKVVITKTPEEGAQTTIYCAVDEDVGKDTGFGSINFEDMTMERKYTPVSAYSRSKLANILFTKVLAEKLKDSGVTTYVLHPGAIKTELGRHIDTTWMYRIGMKVVITKTPEEGAQTTIYCAIDEDVGKDTGCYYR
ncbi:hypothetical protein C0J52_19304 [Blattella germanica]|nr:hypothetical protein C0J52_19304 [Blattella germanica]